MSHHVLLGCGYLGMRIGRLWVANGDTVAVLTRSPQRVEELRQAGFLPTVGDVTQPESLVGLFRGHPYPASLVYAVGYDHSQVATIGDVYAKGLASVLQVASAQLEQVIYVSTTGVYGDAAGQWVDETTPLSPTRPGGLASMAAEQVLTASRFAPRGAILRLAGIYGPGRLPYLDALRRGEPIDASPEGYLNLVHVDDAAELIVAMTRRKLAAPGPLTYCVSDGQPVWREDFYSELARQLAAPLPRFRGDSTSPRRERGASSKRVSSRKVRDEYGFEFRYPSYREGIAQIVSQLSSD